MLRTRLKEALVTAMKARDTVAVATLRLILAALKDRDIAARGKGNLTGIPEEAILDLLQSMIRQRHESIDLYRIGERLDLVQREGAEIEVIQRFLPAQMDEAEVESAVGETVAELKATSLKDMGRTMAALKERYAGRMDFAKAGALVKKQLT
ncbi:GatB/YqeY domain-containing protein [Shumkonia mesophila]|uniref:GatB/YqeY domain-containing protein n=1 Tax=Shumkonia mesophila TaxID=2838854 RepID=UPI002934E1D3|nr:GatB/YqeY domain-containing protein [Shumkonia mesophila]